MPSQTNEAALEAAIEKALTGYSIEELKRQEVIEPQEDYLGGNGFYRAKVADFNAHYALDEHRFWHFLAHSQASELDKLKRHSDWKLRILDRLDRMIKKEGILRLLHEGLKVDDAHFTLLYQLPMASSSQAVKDNFEKNEFSVTRQVPYSKDNPREEIDMVIFINGLPIATLELKNAWTGQTAKVQGIRQYQSRDVRQALLQFGRCIVHFAVDTDEVYMCTKLDGANSFFLPFNKGNNNGKGNPPNPFGHKSAYLWEEILTRERLANIIQHFVRLDGDGKRNEVLQKKNLFFPRYHQLDVVRKLLQHAAKHGVGHRYLIQHSAGSGKSNSIAWAAYQLIEVYPEREDLPGAKGKDLPLFDSVIVVTDRVLLDRQLQQNIQQFAQVKKIVAHATSSKELKENLEQGKKIIITTIFKFPFIVEGIDDLSDKRFAIIIDEAHSSQSGTTADKMNQTVSKGQGEEEEDDQDKILKAIEGRKIKENTSYFAFTATPKNATLEKFGTKQPDGSFKPFHLYAMKQAIEEGFILDVLANYTTYKSYYEIEKSIEDNPLFDTQKAQKKLRAYVERHKQTIATKAEIILEHFISSVYNTKKLKGKAKAMVISHSIESAIRYYFAINQILKDKGNPFKILIAFSDSKIVDGIEYSEASINGFSESDTKDKFDSDEYRILVVANKYLTGFDQPKLCAMYVDKKLQGVLAVQALSRLNRAADKLGKKTEDLFVLDFFNEVQDIKAAFDPFYTSTSLSGATDVNVLHDLKSKLDELGVYEWPEVEDFIYKYFEGVDAQQLSPIIDRAAHRFNLDLGLEDQEKIDFKIKAKQFVKIYGQMASMIPYQVLEWEKLFWFLKFLVPKLLIRSKQDELIDELLESVDLSTYGLERTKLNHRIGLDDSETALDPQNPNPRGAYMGDQEKNSLDEIIRSFNEKWFQGWDSTPEDQRIKFISISNQIRAHKDYESKVAKNKDPQNRDLAFKQILDEVMTQQRRRELDLYRLYTQDESFYQALFDTMKRMMDVPRL